MIKRIWNEFSFHTVFMKLVIYIYKNTQLVSPKYRMKWKFISDPIFIPIEVASFNGFHFIMCLLHCTSGWSVHDDTTPAPGTLYHAGQPCCTSGSQARKTAIYRRHRYHLVKCFSWKLLQTLNSTKQKNASVLIFIFFSIVLLFWSSLYIC